MACLDCGALFCTSLIHPQSASTRCNNIPLILSHHTLSSTASLFRNNAVDGGLRVHWISHKPTAREVTNYIDLHNFHKLIAGDSTNLVPSFILIPKVNKVRILFLLEKPEQRYWTHFRGVPFISINFLTTHRTRTIHEYDVLLYTFPNFSNQKLKDGSPL